MLRPFGKPITVHGNAVVVSDIHLQYHDGRMIEAAHKAASIYSASNLIIAGDLFSFDQYGKYQSISVSDSLASDLAAAKSLLSYWAEAYSNIYFVRGNHDQRIMSAGKVDMTVLVDMIKGGSDLPITHSWYNYLYLRCRGKWLITHQYQYSRNQLKVANELAMLYHCNVIACHQHFASMGISHDGKHTIVDNPCMCKESLTPYKSLDISAYPRWQVGFTIVSDKGLCQYVDNAAWSISL